MNVLQEHIQVLLLPIVKNVVKELFPQKIQLAVKHAQEELFQILVLVDALYAQMVLIPHQEAPYARNVVLVLTP